MAIPYHSQNSFTKSPSINQIITYILVLAQLCIFILTTKNSYHLHYKPLIFIVLFGISMICQLLGGLICSCIDPADSNLLVSNQIQVNNPQLLPCQSCQKRVFIDSYHCRTCNRCCEKLDHHCVWINNCIGIKNYKYFIVMLCGSISTKIMLIAIIINLTLQNKSENSIGIMVGYWIYLAINIIIFILLFNLIMLHIYLNYLGISTYQYFIRNAIKVQEQTRENIYNNQNKKEQQRKMQRVEGVQLEQRRVEILQRPSSQNRGFSDENRQSLNLNNSNFIQILPKMKQVMKSEITNVYKKQQSWISTIMYKSHILLIPNIEEQISRRK